MHINGPYLSTNYNMKSTHEFLQMLKRTQQNQGILALLEAENLFTNDRVDEIIDIIRDSVDKNDAIPPPSTKPNILKKLLHACTTKVLFYDNSGNIYTNCLTTICHLVKTRYLIKSY